MKEYESTGKKGVIRSSGYTIGGALVLNGVLQLLIYPILNRTMGSEQLGNLLYIMGMTAIVCPSVGQSLNTGRLVLRRDYDVRNGDYNIAVLFFGAIGTAAALLIAHDYLTSFWHVVVIALLFMATSFRYYGDVEYRLSLAYRGYFVYYAAVSAGYLIGFGLYRLGLDWPWVFITGECVGLFFLAATGSVFKGFFKTGPFFSLVMRRESFLVLSYFLTNLTFNVDRLVLKHTLGSLAVTQYYVTSLIGKTLVLLVAPINTILISYMTKKRIRLNIRQFTVYAGAGFAVAVVFFAAAQIGTPLFVRLFYPELCESVRPIVTVVNVSQILGLLSAYLFMVVLTFTSEKWQFSLQLAHLIILFACIGFLSSGILPFSIAVLIANAIRIAAIMILGYVKVPKSGS